jgi:hypothetical protein
VAQIHSRNPSARNPVPRECRFMLCFNPGDTMILDGDKIRCNQLAGGREQLRPFAGIYDFLIYWKNDIPAANKPSRYIRFSRLPKR